MHNQVNFSRKLWLLHGTDKQIRSRILVTNSNENAVKTKTVPESLKVSQICLKDTLVLSAQTMIKTMAEQFI